MTARFNETGARSLLLNTLPIDSNVDVLLENIVRTGQTTKNISVPNIAVQAIVLNTFHLDEENLTTLPICDDLDNFKKVSDKDNFEEDFKLEKAFIEIATGHKYIVLSDNKVDQNETNNDRMEVDDDHNKSRSNHNDSIYNNNNVYNKNDINNNNNNNSNINNKNNNSGFSLHPSEKNGEKLNDNEFTQNENYNYANDDMVEIFSNEINDILPSQNEALINPVINNEDLEPGNLDFPNADQAGDGDKSYSISISNSKSKSNCKVFTSELAARLKTERSATKKVFEDFDFIRAETLRVGDGNKQIAETFSKIKRSIKTVPNDKVVLPSDPNKPIQKKRRKDDGLFYFDETEEVTRKEIFEDKNKQVQDISDEWKVIPRKKIPSHLFIDTHMFFTLFSIPEKRYTIGLKDQDDDDEKMVMSPEGLPLMSEEVVKNEFNFDIEVNANIENNARIDKDFEKRFGRLYKTFDVRYLKSKIWDSISKYEKESTMSFRNILESVTRNVSSEVRNNISAQTCFVCLLHLANEKEEECETEFLIKNFRPI